jgi:hypothetical protein
LDHPAKRASGRARGGNSLAARALVRLAASGEPRYAPYAAGILRAFGGQLEKEPRALPYILWGLAEYRLAGLPEEVAMSGAEPLLPRTSDRVRVEARLSPVSLAPGREADLEVTLSMDEGWHIVANPTSLDTLIPTSVQTEIDGGELQVIPRYPAGRKIDSPLGKVAIYENGITIPARLVPVRLPKGRQSPLVISVHAQACNDTGRCLLPSTIRAEIPVEPESGD